MGGSSIMQHYCMGSTLATWRSKQLWPYHSLMSLDAWILHSGYAKSLHLVHHPRSVFSTHILSCKPGAWAQTAGAGYEAMVAWWGFLQILLVHYVTWGHFEMRVRQKQQTFVSNGAAPSARSTLSSSFKIKVAPTILLKAMLRNNS